MATPHLGKQDHGDPKWDAPGLSINLPPGTCMMVKLLNREFILRWQSMSSIEMEVSSDDVAEHEAQRIPFKVIFIWHFV